MALKVPLIMEIREKGLAATVRTRIEKMGILPRTRILEITRARPTRIKTY